MGIVPHTVGIVVKDMAAALAFYRALGLEIAAGEEHSPHVEVAVPDGCNLGFTTEALTLKSNPDWLQPTGQRVTLAFKLDSAAAVDVTYARMTAAGYGGLKAPWDAFWGERYAFLQDPDGSRVDIFAPLGS